MRTFRNSVRSGLALLVCVVSFGAFGLNSSTMASGVWGQAAPAEFADGVQNEEFKEDSFSSVSCASAGNCTAVGQFKNVGGNSEAFTMTSTDGVWGQATPAEFADGVQNDRPRDRFQSVSCGSAGNCTAVGYFRNAGYNKEAFTMTSTDGVWGQATPAVFADGVASTDEAQARFVSVSCGSAGNCTAVGDFRNVGGSYEVFTMTSTDGVWGLATPAEFADGVQNEEFKEDSFSSVSCASAGNCTAVGQFKNVGGDYEAFTMTSTDGVWGQGTPAVFADGVQGEDPYANFNSVSCASAGHCTAVGQFTNVDSNYEAFTMTSTDGVWGQGTPAVFADGVQGEYKEASFYSVSCGSVGNCSAVGYFANVNENYEAFTMTSTDGVWGQATPVVFADGVQGEYKEASFYSVSCGSVGNCSAVGYFANVNENYEAFTMTSTDGVWGQATPVVFADGVQYQSPSSESFSVSCGSVGNCSAVGYFTDTDSNSEAFTMMSTYTPPAETTTTVAATTTTVTQVTALPATGSDSNGWLVAAMCAVITGTILLTRRRRIS